MRLIRFALLLVWTSCGFAAEPKICLNMIVKNEKEVICRCLESVKPLIDYWVIVDTGSTDGTQEVIKSYFKDIPGELHERPWVNFAHNRNEALELARSKADYLLIIDADDVLTYSPEFKKPKKLDADGYMILIEYGGMNYERIQLVKSSFPWFWDGVVHEVLFSNHPFHTPTLSDVTMKIIGGGDRSQDSAKFAKDAKLLEEALKKDPSSTRNMFYLAQSYRDAGEFQKSLDAYEKRVAMGGWDQEVFWSLYQIGILKDALGKSESEVVSAYQKAYLYRPSRLEPLYQLSLLYRKSGNYLLGYALAKVGMQMAPSKDPLFVEAWMEQYGIKLEASICAYYLERYEEAKELSEQLLADHKTPDHVVECLKGNLRFIHDKLCQREFKN